MARLLPNLTLLLLALLFTLTSLTKAEVPTEAPTDITVSEWETLQASSEKHQFQAEVSRMMKLIINSLYQNKEIFLRELISNASDAIEKVRTLALKEPELLGQDKEFKIQVKADPINRTLIVRDNGVGMGKDELIKNLGTIARSGTSEFLAALDSKKGDLIGQFGVGFYSIFLVADRVTVTSRQTKDDQWVWLCDAEHQYSIIKDTRPDHYIERGTEVTLHLKEDATAFLKEDKLKELIKKYSEFINYPIYLYTTTKRMEEVPLTEEEIAAENAKREEAKLKREEAKKKKEEAKEGDAQVEDAEDEKKDEISAEPEEGEIPTTKKIEKEVSEYSHVNQNKPIWKRDPAEVTPAEYSEFYTGFHKDSGGEALAYSHFRAEGEVEFSSLLFIPNKPPFNVFSNADTPETISLYVRRVFITKNFGDEPFLERWAAFVVGLVDSDDLPLNVSRETLQAHLSLKVIKKKMLKKTIEMIQSLANDKPDKFTKFYETYGNNLKLGVVSDSANRKKLSDLLRFHSSSGDFVSLKEYTERMKEGQKAIFFLAGSDLAQLKKSIFIEKLLGRGYEVLYMTDPIDEHMVQSLNEYSGHSFQNVAKDGLKFGDEAEEDKKALEEVEASLKPLSSWLQSILSTHIDKVVISNRLLESPCAIVAHSFGWSGNMAKIMKSHTQDKNDPMTQFFASQKKIFEINPTHPIIKEMAKRIPASSSSADSVDKKEIPVVNDPQLERMAKTLFDTALVTSGYEVPDMKEFAHNIDHLIRATFGVDHSAKPEIEVKPAPPTRSKATEETDKEASKEGASKEDDKNESKESELDEFAEKLDL